METRPPGEHLSRISRSTARSLAIYTHYQTHAQGIKNCHDKRGAQQTGHPTKGLPTRHLLKFCRHPNSDLALTPSQNATTTSPAAARKATPWRLSIASTTLLTLNLASLSLVCSDWSKTAVVPPLRRPEVVFFSPAGVHSYVESIFFVMDMEVRAIGSPSLQICSSCGECLERSLELRNRNFFVVVRAIVEARGT